MNKLNKLIMVMKNEMDNNEELFWNNVAEDKYAMVAKNNINIAIPFLCEAGEHEFNPMEYYNFTDEELEVYYKGWNIK